MYHKNEARSSMSTYGCYKIGSYVNFKELNGINLSECVCPCGGDKKTQTLYGKVLASLKNQSKLGELAGLHALGSVWVVVKKS